jgi:hypothetical protein
MVALTCLPCINLEQARSAQLDELLADIKQLVRWRHGAVASVAVLMGSSFAAGLGVANLHLSIQG